MGIRFDDESDPKTQNSDPQPISPGLSDKDKNFLRKDLDVADNISQTVYDPQFEFEASEGAEQKKFKSWEAEIREIGITEKDVTEEQLWEFFRSGKIEASVENTQRLKQINKQRGQEMMVNGLISTEEYEKNYNKD